MILGSIYGNENDALARAVLGCDKTRTCIQELQSAFEGLPHVDDEGHSECQFAEQLYATKEEHERKVRQMLGSLHTALAAVEAEIKRLEQRRAVVRSGRERIRSKGAGKEYVVAEEVLERRLQEHRKARTDTKAMIKTAELALAMAATKMFPGRKPQKPVAVLSLHGSPVPTPTGPHRPGPSRRLHDPVGVRPQHPPQGPSIGNGVPGPLR